MKLPGGGGEQRYFRAGAAVRSGKTVYVIEFGGINPSDTNLAATTILQMCKYMVGGVGSVDMSVFLPLLSPSSAPYEY